MSIPEFDQSTNSDFIKFPVPLEVDRELYLSLFENIHFWYTEFPAPFEVNRFHYDRRDFG